MQAVCKGMDHCSNYLSMRIDLTVHASFLHYTHHAHTSHRKPLAASFTVWLYPPLVCFSLGPASQTRAVVVVVGWYSLHSLEIRVNSGNHFQLPSSDYFGVAAWHCEMGLGVSAAIKKEKKEKEKPLSLLSVVFSVLECIEPESLDGEAKGTGTIAAVSLISEWCQNSFLGAWKNSQKTYKSIKFKKTKDVIWRASKNRDSIVSSTVF